MPVYECSDCGEMKDKEEYLSYQDKRRPNSSPYRLKRCKACERIRRAAFRNEKARKRKIKLVKMMGNKCADCGGVFPTCCYDFHHKDPETKEKYGIGRMALYSWKRIKKEAENCVMLCSNCHRVRHHGEENGYI